ncbi:hypothetical protein D5018_00665 [Parashewanella curva]|uniref:Uncharacterized protein n=1 Tax=Parashewanella curva TaxID=2338552 RepID=A0A3L8Q3H8_9GAMM|nr:hypothetical protein [Parashewanella curva]RLV61663.1 hypothetical protein D5018_00665 [Parashewanella curva]
MSGISVGTHGNNLFLTDKDTSVVAAERVTAKALAKTDRWVSFSIKTPDGKTVKKFQLKVVSQSGAPADNQVEVRRNNFSAKFHRAFLSLFSPHKLSEADKPLAHFSQDLFSRYASSQTKIAHSSERSKPATEHLFDAEQLAQASKPFMDDHGHHVVMSPSQIIDKLNEQAHSDESIALVFDLDETLYTETDYHGSTDKNTKSLDPKLPQKLKLFKEKYPNAKLIAITQTPHSSKPLAEAKLKKCGYEFIFDVLNTKGDPKYKDGDGRSLGGKGERFSAILEEEKTNFNWSPQRVIFFDDDVPNLNNLKQVSEELGMQYEGYHVHTSQHVSAHKHQQIPSADEDRLLNRDELAKLVVTEKTLTDNLKPAQRHRSRMLR